MRKIISKSRAEGHIYIPASKSIAHRMLIAAALCPKDETLIRGLTLNDDLLATIDCLKVLGVKIDIMDDVARVVGIDFSTALPTDELNCRESGSTLRFLLPLALLCGKRARFIGSQRLFERPISVYEKIGISIEKNDRGIVAEGKITAGEYSIPGDISSQFITGLIFALSEVCGKSIINITTKIESKSYIDMTLDVLRDFGIVAEWVTDNSIVVYGGQRAHGGDFTLEGDWSSAAFIEALNHLGGRITINGLKENSLQADRVCREYFEALDRGYCELNIENCPDLGPILFAMAAIKSGAKFLGTKRLKIKESDRNLAMKTELQKFGAELVIEENTVTVLPRELHAPTELLYGHNDHRIVMSLAVICSLFGGEIDGSEAVSKSYPNFWSDLNSLGIKVS